MKKTCLLFMVLLATHRLFAQNGSRPARTPAPLPPPLALREVSGIVKDTTDNTIIGAIVTLKSKNDSIKVATNNDGIFVLRNVKAATFVLTVSYIGYQTTTRKYLNNDLARKIVLDPIIIKQERNMLKQVTINGTPSITYKTDTVEYKASDYKVRENATVDELLSKMEGMEVGSDGTLTHQGIQVTKARLNGKDYAGGNVAQAIQNLPADIVDKIQVVDDYGDEAARTGVKDGTPQKVLNITTKADRSVGNIGRATVGEGTDDRYNDKLFLQRINANQQISLIGGASNTVNGVASTGINSSSNGTFGSQNSTGGSGGTTKNIAPTLSYSDQLSKKIQITTSYSYVYNNVNSLNNSSGQQYTTLPDVVPVTTGTTYFTNNSNADNINITHKFSFDIIYDIDSANYLRISQPTGGSTFSYTGANSSSMSQEYQTGVIHQTSLGNTTSNSTAPSYGANVFYQHLFEKKRRNISLQLTYTHTNQQQTKGQDNHILYYQDSVSTMTPFLDSLIHRVIQRGDLTNSFRASMTYVEPLTILSQLEFNAQYIRRGYNNNAYTDNIVDSLGGLKVPIDSLTNVYKYSFAEERFAVNYRLNKAKYNLSLGVTAIPTLLEGSRQGLSTQIQQSSFNVIPIFRFQYVWSKTERISINYSGTPTEPTFNEIQPYTDLTNPQNPVIGNPDLKPSFTNTINFQYNNYVPNSQMNISTNIAASFINSQVVTNNVLVPVYVRKAGDTAVAKSYITDTHYVNLNGAYSINGNYNLAKQFDDRRYNLELNGNVTYGYNVAMTNGIENFSTAWSYNERFGPKMDPNDWLEINPYVSYSVAKSTNTLSTYNTDTHTLALSLDGRVNVIPTLLVGYTASKNYVTGISDNLTKNPFVINAYLEKELFKKHNGVLGFQAFDLLHQNNFVNRVVTPTGFTDTKTNALSQYFMVSFRLILQKWTGVPKRNGRIMQRRGDGSFIY
jgi:hypothetical protein